MKLTVLVSTTLFASVAAFAPQGRPSFMVAVESSLKMAQDPLPFFANSASKKTSTQKTNQSTTAPVPDLNDLDSAVQEEMLKAERASKFKSKTGVEFAPWIQKEDEAKVRQILKEKAAAKAKREAQEKAVSGNLYFDSQAQELSGTGLKSKVIDGQVELEWGTKSETNTKGFIVKRRPAKTEDFTVIASYTEWGPLKSKGVDGGLYRYLDTTSTPGGWVYRVTEVDNNDNQADLCQCLVEVQTEEEQKAALIAGVGIVLIGVAAVVAGLVMDPYAM